jgi:integrase
MPAKPEGVYADGRGGWYFKVTLGRDPLTGKRVQITKRGFRTAAAAGRARRDVLGKVDTGQVRPSSKALTVDELLDLYLDGLDADDALSVKTRFDYRHYADKYVRPALGARKVRDLTPDVILAWQRKLLKSGSVKSGKPLAANTVRLARAPLSGALKLAVSMGVIAVNPAMAAPRPRPSRSVPKHWTPEQAREFLGFMEGDRLYPLWAFLLGSGLRIGELVWLRWPNVDFDRRSVHIVEFVSTLGYKLVPSTGKSRDAVRSIELDEGLMGVLRAQRKLQAEEPLVATDYEDTEYVFTRPAGGSYHPGNLSQLLGRLTVEIGLPRFTAHGLRHTSATLMLASGVPPKVAAERLGHADPPPCSPTSTATSLRRCNEKPPSESAPRCSADASTLRLPPKEILRPEPPPDDLLLVVRGGATSLGNSHLANQVADCWERHQFFRCVRVWRARRQHRAAQRGGPRHTHSAAYPRGPLRDLEISRVRSEPDVPQPKALLGRAAQCRARDVRKAP